MANLDVDLESDDELKLDTEPTKTPDLKTEPAQEPELPDEDQGEQEGSGAEDQPIEAAPKPKSRADARIQSLLDTTKKTQAELQKAREEIAAERARREMLERMTQQKPQEPDPREEEARLAEMAPEDRAAYLLNKSHRSLEQKIELMKFENADQADKMAFAAKAAVDPVYAKYASKVEERVLQLYRTGQVLPREVVLTYLVGEAVMANKGKSKEQAATAKKNVDSQRVAPVAAKGDQAGAQKLDDRQARIKRLENIPL